MFNQTYRTRQKLTEKVGKINDYCNRSIPEELEQRKVLVTGISAGIGKALCDDLTNRNCKVIGVTRLKDGKNRLQAVNKKMDVVHFDWSDYSELVSLLDDWVAQHGSIDAVVHNAGLLIKGGMGDVKKEHFFEQMGVNVWNVYELTNALIKSDHLSSDAHIVSIGSAAGVQSASKFPELFTYSASKAALLSLTQFMDLEWGGKGRSFNYLALGAVNTEMLQTAFPGFISDVSPENMAQFIGDFTLNSGRIMSGQVVEVRKSDPEG